LEIVGVVTDNASGKYCVKKNHKVFFMAVQHTPCTCSQKIW
jgi:hypothetical protein